jgi:signal transduction histidine kinase
LKALKPIDEAERLRTLYSYQLLDTRSEASLDRLVAVAANACETPIGLLTVVDESRQWFKARVGLDMQETDREISFCAHAVASDAPLIVEDALTDPRFADNPLVVDQPGVRFYAGVPIHANNGQALGTLCVIDHVPREFMPNHRQVLEGIAREIEARFEIRRISIERKILVEERAILTNMILQDAAAVLTALGWNLKLLEEQVGAGNEMLEWAQDSIDELVDHCTGVSTLHLEQAQGLIANRSRADLEGWFRDAIQKAGAVAAQAGIEVKSNFDMADPAVVTDTHLLDRMMRSLFRSTVRMCERGNTITVRASRDVGGDVCLVFENDGPAISSDDEKHMFDPYFSKRETAPINPGLELAFCRLAAKALGGSIAYFHGELAGGRIVVRIPEGPDATLTAP